MTLQPGENFVITHQIGDHTDTATYYVQAVIRNARTDETLDTVKLTDRGNQRFSKEWQVPQDPSGQGFYISITTTVYSDSNYSTKSALYSEEQERLLIQARMNPNLGYGSSGSDIDYKKIKKLISEEVKSIKDSFPKRVKITDQTEIVNILNAIKEAIPPKEKDDTKEMKRFDNIDEAIASVEKAIESLSKEEKREKEVEEIKKAIEDSSEDMNVALETIEEMLEYMKESTVSIDLGRLAGLKEAKKASQASEIESGEEEDTETEDDTKEEKQEPQGTDIEGIARRMFIRKNKKR